MKSPSGTVLLLALLFTVNGIYNCRTQEAETLKQAYKDHFLVGAALGGNQINGDDPRAMALTARQFNSITAENVMKYLSTEPKEGQFDFSQADFFLAGQQFVQVQDQQDVVEAFKKVAKKLLSH